jgi:hypothetical protein
MRVEVEPVHQAARAAGLRGKALNQAPRTPMKVTGFVEELLAASLSLPRGEGPIPQTKSELDTPSISS